MADANIAMLQGELEPSMSATVRRRKRREQIIARKQAGLSTATDDRRRQLRVIIPLSAAADSLPDLRSAPSASDAASEASWFTDRWMPDGLLEEDGVDESELNPDAPVFVPRMWLPPVAEDQTLSAPELEHGPAGEDRPPPRPTRPNQRHRAAIARAGSCHVETCLKNFSITAGAVVDREKAAQHCKGEDTAGNVIPAAVPVPGRPYKRANQAQRLRDSLRWVNGSRSSGAAATLEGDRLHIETCFVAQ